MRAYYLGAANGAPTLELRDIPKPEPKQGEMLMRIHASGLNRGEFIPGHGILLGKGDATAKPSGIEAAGEIAAIGPGVTGWKIGARVMGRTRSGFAEYGLIDLSDAIPVPDRLSWEEAASIPITFMTAYDMLVSNGEMKAGDWVLVTGVSSGVGVACLQIAKALGANVIGTSGSPQKLDALKKIGLDHGLAVRGTLPQDEIKRITGGRGIDIVINNVGGTMFAPCIAALGYRGRLATVGYVDGVVEAKIDLDKVHSHRLRLYGVSNKHRSAPERHVNVAGMVRDILPLIASGKITPLVDKVFPFDQLPAAQARMMANEQIGKIVVKQ